MGFVNIIYKKIAYLGFCFSTLGGLVFTQSIVFAHENDSDVIGATDNTQDGKKTSNSVFETIEIRGIRSSIVQSIQTKRQAKGIVDAITAEDIGKFPDKNVAESLQRITGVSLNRIQGEGERVGVRGTAASQNRTTINGQAIASADWWISSQPNRGFNYTLLPAEIVSSLAVHKSPQASDDEGSLGGFVSINTRKPLETEHDLLVGSLQWQYNDVSNEHDPQLSLLYNWRSVEDEFGVSMALIRHERSLRRDGLESWGWTERNFELSAFGTLQETKNSDADFQNIWSAGGGGSAIFQQQRQLTSAMMSMQYQPSDSRNLWSVQFNGLFSRLNADNNNHNFLWQPGEVYAQNGHISDHQIVANTLAFANFEASFNGQPTTAMEAIVRQSKIETALAQVIFNYESGKWQNEYQFGWTKASGGTSEDLTAKWTANTAYSVDTRGLRNIVASYEVSPSDGHAWAINDVRADNHDSKDSEYFAQLDLNYQADGDFIESVEMGAKYKAHQRDFIRFRSVNGGLNGLAGSLDWTLADFSAQFVGGFLQGIGDERTLKHYAMTDVSQLHDAMTALDYIQLEERASRFDISEDSYALYAQGNFEQFGFAGNFGVRIVHTEQQASAYGQVASPVQTDAMPVWESADKNYTDVLPSLNIVFDWSKSMVIRLSASKVMSRPEYHHLMPSTNYNLTQAQGSGGDPQLEPFRATKFDMGFEWYFDEVSMFSMMFFSQNVKSFIDIHRNLEVYEQTEMVIARPVNGNGGQIQGIEMSYQQELLYGVGVMANYTYVQGERRDSLTGAELEIPGHSDHTYNLTTYYENDWLGMRLSYNHRSTFATGMGEEITDSFGQWDANINVNINDSFSLVFEGINLTDEILYSYERNEYAPVGIYRNGRRLYAGVRFEF